MQATRRAGSTIAIVGLLTLAAILLASRVSGSGKGHSDDQKGAAILAAMKSSGLGTHMYPRSEGTRRCTVHGGGPAPGVSFPGAICKTRIVFGQRGTAIVYFTHMIDGGAHTWMYRVSPSLRVRFVRDFGPGIAPEYWS